MRRLQPRDIMRLRTQLRLQCGQTIQRRPCFLSWAEGPRVAILSGHGFPSISMASPLCPLCATLKTEWCGRWHPVTPVGLDSPSPGTRERWGRERHQGQQPAEKAEEAPTAQGAVHASTTLLLVRAGPWDRLPPELPPLPRALGGPPPEGLVPVLPLHSSTHAQPHSGWLWALFQHALFSVPSRAPPAPQLWAW
jgi:hypothetical protein